MKEMKKYMSITRYGKSTTIDALNRGDIISITEKIDGANASFCKDDESDLGVSCYSRDQIVTGNNTLKGYYDWIIKTIVPIKDKLNPNYRYFGEWLSPHRVIYKDECYYNFYLFSIWDDVKQQYLSDDIVKSEAKRLNLKTPEYFYYGEYKSFEHLMSFVGKSNMTKEKDTGEGIVIKNINYFNKQKEQMFIKIVSKNFAEVKDIKEFNRLNTKFKAIDLIKMVLTKARVSKLIHKLVDEGLLHEDFSVKDIGLILKLLGDKPYEDIIKEEGDLFEGYNEKLLKEIIRQRIPLIIKGALKDENRF